MLLFSLKDLKLCMIPVKSHKDPWRLGLHIAITVWHEIEEQCGGEEPAGDLADVVWNEVALKGQLAGVEVLYHLLERALKADSS